MAMMLLCCVDVTTAWAAMRVTWALHELPGMAVSHRPWHALVEGVGHHARSTWLVEFMQFVAFLVVASSLSSVAREWL